MGTQTQITIVFSGTVGSLQIIGKKYKRQRKQSLRPVNPWIAFFCPSDLQNVNKKLI